MPSARPSATATIMISSSSEPEAEEPRSTLGLVFGGRGLDGLGLLAGDDRLVAATSAAGRFGLGERLLVDGVTGYLVVGGRGRLHGGIVQETRLDGLLRPGVATLAHASALAYTAAQVVQLGSPHVAASGDLDALDLGRVQGERALDTDAEGLLADGEGLAHPLALALEDDALEDLRTAARTLDHLEVDADPVAGLKSGHPAELRALEVVDDGAHSEEKPREPREAVAAAAYGSEAPPDRSARSRDCCARHARMRAWWPLSSTSGTVQPRHSAGRV